MHSLDNCIFCQIVQGKAPCYKIYEDDATLAFLDIFPATAGHVLIITKEHFSDIFAATPEALARVAASSVLLAKAIDRVIKPDGLGVYQLNKAAAGQTVFHYHMHLIPQFTDKNISIHSKQQGDPEQLSALAEQFKTALIELTTD
ncbi:MAG: HIT family protein [Spongiibacteraceae bacterium]